MRHNEYDDGNYIVAVGIGDGGTEITETRYNTIMSIIQDAPHAPDGYAYKLRTDLTWEMVELPPEPDVPTVEDKAEAYDIIIGEAD